jgi:hypothetical protein
MTARNKDTVGPGRYNNNKSAKDRPPGPSRGRTRRSGTVRIAGHETRIMTPGEYDNAVEALAVLIGRWLDDHPDPCPVCALQGADGRDSDADGHLAAA